MRSPTPAFIICGLLCNLSPSIAALIVIRISKGQEGIRALKAKFKQFYVPMRDQTLLRL